MILKEKTNVDENQRVMETPNIECGKLIGTNKNNKCSKLIEMERVYFNLQAKIG